MTKQLLSKNISIDTSYFESQNFLAGSKLTELSNLHKENLISLYITDIIYKEVIARFIKNIREAEEKVKKPKKLLENHASVLRNFADFDTYFKLPEIDINDLTKKFQTKFDAWIKDNEVEVISTGHLTINDIFDDYFNNNPPFKEGIKKHEFPDAFTLKAFIEKFKGTNSYLLTGDNDLLSFQNETLIPTNDIAELIDLIIRTHKENIKQEAIFLVETAFHREKEKFETKIKELITSAVENEVGLTISLGDLEIDSLNHLDLSDIEFQSFSIIHLGENEAKIECEISFSLEVSFSAEDKSEAWYDKEDDIWHFVKTKNFSVSDNYNIPVTFIAEFDTNDGYIEIDLDELNYGKDLDIFDNFNEW